MKNTLRIAVTGPESSGKTTLSETLAQELNGLFVPEFAREYLLALKRPYTQDDLDRIAEGQVRSWESDVHSPLISDTEMLVMTVWSEVRFGQSSPYIQAQLAQQRFDHYFLCFPDIPWEEDPLREHPTMRDELFERYHQKLLELKLPFTLIKGGNEERMRVAMEVIAGL